MTKICLVIPLIGIVIVESCHTLNKIFSPFVKRFQTTKNIDKMYDISILLVAVLLSLFETKLPTADYLLCGEWHRITPLKLGILFLWHISQVSFTGFFCFSGNKPHPNLSTFYRYKTRNFLNVADLLWLSSWFFFINNSFRFSICFASKRRKNGESRENEWGWVLKFVLFYVGRNNTWHTE